MIEGDTACPQCGKHLWTMTYRRGPATFGPDPKCPILASRQRAHVRSVWLARLFFRLCPKTVRCSALRTRISVFVGVQAVMGQVSRCREPRRIGCVFLGRPICRAARPRQQS